MPVHILDNRSLEFPPPDTAGPDGLLAIGGDLSAERILAAYRLGIFPWYTEGHPIHWWSPDPRLVLFPDEIKISRSLRQTIKKCKFWITIDRQFNVLIERCRAIHRLMDGSTWMTDEMMRAYKRLHRLGHCHSVESRVEAVIPGGTIAGGLYGVSMGAVFFGESMFSLESDASKVALVYLCEKLREWGYGIIDCQVKTPHLMSMGAREISRNEFMRILERDIDKPVSPLAWK